MTERMTRLLRGAILLVLGGIFGMAYILKWIPYSDFPLNRVQLVIDDMWVCLGWMPWLIFSTAGLMDLVGELYY